jgi:hypothetical protein
MVDFTLIDKGFWWNGWFLFLQISKTCKNCDHFRKLFNCFASLFFSNQVKTTFLFLYPSTGLLLNGLLSPLWPSVPSTTFCHPLWPSVSSTASVLSETLCLLYDPLSPLRPSVPSTTLCPLCGPLPLYSPLSSLQPPASSTAPCLLYGTLSHLRDMLCYLSLVCKMMMLFCCFANHVWRNRPFRKIAKQAKQLCLDVTSTHEPTR